MSEATENLFAVLFIHGGLLMCSICSFWKRKEPYLKHLVGLGIIWNIWVGSWGFLIMHFFMKDSEVAQEDYGVILGAFFQDGYFIYFHAALLIGYGYLIVTRLRSH